MRKKYDYNEWYSIVEPIITSPEYERRKTFRHHGDVTVYTHSVKVSKLSYRMAKFLHANYRNAAIAGILHDLYTTPWQEDTEKKPFFKQHGFVHAHEALMNSRKYYPDYLNEKIEDAIERHMFPLNITPPRHVAGYILTIADKVSSMDLLFSKEAMSKIFLPHHDKEKKK